MKRNVGIVLVLFFMVNTLFASDFWFKLTKAERIYLARHNSIRIAGDDSYYPFEYKSINGEAKGYIVDYYKLVSKKTGIKFEHRVYRWETVPQLVDRGQADIISMLFTTPKREKNYCFTLPVAQVKSCLFYHPSIGKILTLNDIEGFVIGITKGDAIKDQLITVIPNLHFMEYDSYEKVITAYKEGQIKVFAMDYPQAMYLMGKHNIQNTNVLEQPITTNYLYSAVSKRDSVLVSILNKGFQLVSKEELASLNKKWIGIKHTHADKATNQYKLIVKVVYSLSIVVLISLLVYYHTRMKKINYKHRKQTELLQKLHHAFLAEIVNDTIQLIKKPEMEPGLLDRLQVSDWSSLERAFQSNEEMLSIAKQSLSSEYGAGEIELVIAKEKIKYRLTSWKYTDTIFQFKLEPLIVGSAEKSEIVYKNSQQIFNALPHAIFCIDEKFKTCIINNKARYWFGQSIKDKENSSIIEILPFLGRYERDIEHSFADMKYCIDNRVIIEINKRDYWVDISLIPYYVENEKRLMIIITDITYDQFQQQKRVQKEKVEFLTRSVNGIVSNFNNIVTGMLGNIDLLKLKVGMLPLSSERDMIMQYVARIVECVSIESNLLKQLLRLTESTRLLKESIPINMLIEDLVSNLKMIFMDQVVIHYEPPKENLQFEGVYGLIYQSFFQLAMNARESIVENGTVTIEIHSIRLTGNSQEDYIQVRIIDTGLGIASSVEEHIYEPLYSTKAKDETAGFGLSLAQKVILQHDGWIQIQTKENVGTIVSVYLPRKCEE